MASKPQVAAAPSPALVLDTLMAHQRTAALRAAIELDLFRALGEGRGTDAATLARHCSASERGMRILCDYLTVIGLISKKDGRYSHTATSAMFLDPGSPACIASTARFLGNPAMVEPYLHLADIVRNGRTTLPGEGSVEPENPVWVEFAHSMAPMMAPMAGPLGTIVLQDRTGTMRVLDIAAGHGLFGIEIAKQHGVIAQRFYGSDDGQIMVIDEWPDPESFQRFYAATAAEIEPMMREVGVTAEPEVTFWRKLDTGDDVGWS